MKYYAITAKRGHCGCTHYYPITFAMYGNNILEAMDKARQMPAVKHSDQIIDGREISFAEYCRLRKTSAYERIYGYDSTQP